MLQVLRAQRALLCFSRSLFVCLCVGVFACVRACGTEEKVLESERRKEQAETDKETARRHSSGLVTAVTVWP